MSKIWICQSKTADIPFTLKEKNISLYSFEELCYYLHRNTEAIEEELFGEQLLNWLESELHMTRLCEQLRQGLEEGRNVFWCIGKLLWESGYYTRKEIEDIQKIAVDTLRADPVERSKRKADRLLLNGNYKRAVREYRLLLQENMERQMESRIWHNMGTAYAGQFLFARAAECYEKAYELGRLEESRKQYLSALACAEGTVSDETESSIQSELQQVKEEQGFRQYETAVYQKLEKLAEEYMRSE